MKLRLTPLNILTSILLVSIAYLLLFPDENGFRELGSIPLIILLILSFITDQVFRRFIPELKRIWLIELLFLIFVAVLMILIKLYIFNWFENWHQIAIGLGIDFICDKFLPALGWQALKSDKQWAIKSLASNNRQQITDKTQINTSS